MAELLKGAPVARALTERLSARADALKAAGVTPRLAVIRAGERPDDLSYERGLLKRCEKVGIDADVPSGAGCTQEGFFPAWPTSTPTPPCTAASCSALCRPSLTSASPRPSLTRSRTSTA